MRLSIVKRQGKEEKIFEDGGSRYAITPIEI